MHLQVLNLVTLVDGPTTTMIMVMLMIMMMTMMLTMMMMIRC